jgi:hypothetical protein
MPVSPCAPGCQPQPGTSLAGQPGPAGERARQVLPRRQVGMLDDRAGGGEAVRVAGLGQDRGRAHTAGASLRTS